MSPEIVELYGDNVATETIEVKVNDQSGRYYLPDNAILRDKKILDWFVVGNPNNDAVSPTGRPLVTPALMRGSYITLKVVNDDVVSDFPLIQRTITEDDRGLSRWEACPLSPTKSYITLGNPSAAVAGQSYVLVFVYLNV